MPLFRPLAVAPISQPFDGAFSWEPYGFVRTDRKVHRGGRYSFNRKATYRSHVHLAIDYPTPVGTKVRAFKAGTVIAQGMDSSGAYFCYLRVRRGAEHDITALYYHLSQGSFRFPVGGKVRKGQTIALSGNTGFSTGPHLHVELIRSDRGATVSEIYREGIRLDPQPFIDGDARLRDIAP